MNLTPRRARSRTLPPRSTSVTSPKAFAPAGMTTRSPTLTSRVTRATTLSSTCALSLVTGDSNWRPMTESAATTSSSKNGAGGSTECDALLSEIAAGSMGTAGLCVLSYDRRRRRGLRGTGRRRDLTSRGPGRRWRLGWSRLGRDWLERRRQGRRRRLDDVLGLCHCCTRCRRRQCLNLSRAHRRRVVPERQERSACASRDANNGKNDDGGSAHVLNPLNAC